MKLTGGQIVAKALKANGVDYVAGMPADGLWALVEALLTPGTDIPFIQVMQEQSAVHLADGYFRACGRPMAALLPVPLGVSKALGGVAAALADSSAMLIISGGSVEYDGHPPEDMPSQITKEQVQVSAIEQLPQALRQSFDTMFSRVVPVSLEIPAAVQNATIDVSLAPATLRASSELQRADPRFKITALREDRTTRWDADSASDAAPMLAQRPLAELRSVLERDAILVVGSGSIQALVREMIPVYYPRSHLCATSVGMVGWAVPAAIGAKLAMPARQVVCAVGDGDFLQSMQEMAVCVMHSIPVVFLVFNNSGYVSLSDVQTPVVEQHRAGEFNLPDGKPYSPDFAGIARNFGLEAWRVEHASQLNPTFIKALNSKGPALVEVITARSSRVN
ncbi:thiamine pyrophosphate-dependent enzyme [Pseudomonas arsenicoxydans]|uniref:Acetolactate synthase n=1 Tax=Pseudomonas arsenicoxydans TaxID=702115 RepID=A0A4P6G5G0_9PSED|nr:thiamine pyrophosphate-dependent enzyme [Pseudomonas arsenicoxydans]QAY85426.1 acetolactate synthase [Pseudomonas arsenicoxydans]